MPPAQLSTDAGLNSARCDARPLRASSTTKPDDSDEMRTDESTNWNSATDEEVRRGKLSGARRVAKMSANAAA
jgi:hypothetical protein